MLVSTNSDAPQTYTNTLSLGTTPVTTGASYRISANPGSHGSEEISVDPATGEVTFTRALYDNMTPSDLTQPTGPPAVITIEAAYQGRKASYTFTVTDHFRPRSYHSSVVRGNDIYVIGGETQDYIPPLGPGPPRQLSISSDEVWRSSDGGLTWDQVAETDPAKRFSPARHAHSAVVLGEDIYVIAGLTPSGNLNDVWKSADRGVSWNQTTATAAFSARRFTTAEVLNDALYLMGGFTGIHPSLNDVWRSTDGVTWTDVTNTTTTSPPRFAGRLSPASVVLPGSGAGGADELCYIGGFTISAVTPQNVYKSGDGTTWTQLTPVPGFANDRYNHTAVVLGGDIYVIAGQEGSTIKRDVWKSQDNGQTWRRITPSAGAEFGDRTRHSSAVQGGAMYLIGGSLGPVNQLHNDVWRSTDGQTWVNVHKNP